MPERETKAGEKEEQLQAEKPCKKKKKSDANKENRPAAKDKLVSIFLLVKQLIQQQDMNGVQVVANVGTLYSVLEEDHNIVPSTVREISATKIPLSQPPPSSDLVSNDELAAIKLKSSGPTAFAGVLFRTLFTLDEMRGRNCHGLAKKGKHGEGKLNKIQEYVYRYYPDTPEQLSGMWGTLYPNH